MTYTVHVTFQHPAWDERNGFDYRGISAKNKSEAIRRARFQARNDGHTGKLIFHARLDKEDL